MAGLIDHLLNSPDYLNAFGHDMVPYQRGRVLRGRVLAGQAKGRQPFNQQAPRDEGHWRDTSSRRAPAGRGSGWSPASGITLPRPAWLAGWLADAQSPQARRIWQGIVTVGGFVLSGLVLDLAATMLSTTGAG
jgi:phycobilisome rod-core linker protein